TPPGPNAASTARALRAVALPRGAAIVWAEGGYAPGTSRGRELLAHELTHVVQQERSGTPGGPRASEGEAVRNAKLVHEMRPLRVATAASGVQRQPQTASSQPSEAEDL